MGEEGLVFVDAEDVYAAFRVIRGGYDWENEIITYHGADSRTMVSPPGKMMILHKEYSPVILEVMAKSDLQSFEAFKARVKECKLHMERMVFQYCSSDGDLLTLDTGYEKTPTINGKPVNYSPAKAFESHFPNNEWNSGIVAIIKGSRKKSTGFQ